MLCRNLCLPIYTSSCTHCACVASLLMSGGITSSIANDTIQKQLFTTHCETPSI
jgi:hypothetical protein